MRQLASVIAISLAVAGLGAAPAARAQAYAPDRVVNAVTTADLHAVIASLGHMIVEEGSETEPYILATSESGTSYTLTGTACNVNGVAGCQGVMMQVRFNAEPGITADDLLRAAYSQAALGIWRDPADGTIGVTRYVVLDYGVTMANIRENVNVMLAVTPEVVTAILAE